MNNTSGIVLKSIGELIKSELKFVVPSYQRGYRWTKRQVEELLDDIWEFSQKNKNDNSFYCLQPIVIKKIEENKYELIDGQQRLTTLYLIFKFLQSCNKFDEKIFTIEYETRSKEFLEKINKEKNRHDCKDENIDYYYMSNSYEFIKEWFNGDKRQFNDDLKDSVKVIWYEVKDINENDINRKNINGIEIFTRINMGKIPLTNAELIKALFLRESNFQENGNTKDEEKIKLRQLEIANEWDNIEYCLQNDEFWYFLNKEENNISTRIEFIFDLIANEIVEDPKSWLENNLNINDEEKLNKLQNKLKNLKEQNKKDDYWTFIVFNELFEYNRDDKNLIIKYLWEKVKFYFLTLQGWFNDRELYHKIGYLITTGKNIKEIISESQERLKSDFKKKIDEWIRETIKIKTIDIENLKYDKDKGTIKKVLLLFNIMTLLKSDHSNLRFSFDSFKKEKWSLEHIHARNSKKLRGKQLENWLEEHKNLLDKIKKLEFDIEHLKDEEMFKDEFSKNNNDLLKLKEEIIKKVSDKIDEIKNKKEKDDKEEEINNIQRIIAKIFKEDEEINSIDNLTLLSIGDNAFLSNNVFAVKREKIIELDKKGLFIPICTKNLFLKYYSKNPSQLYFWSENDRKDYLDEIKKKIKDYLNLENEKDNGQ